MTIRKQAGKSGYDEQTNGLEEVQVIKENDNVGGWSTLSVDPLIQVIDNFVSAENCNYLIKKGKPKLGRALVSSAMGGTESPGRTGSNCWLSIQQDSLVKEISLSISNCVQIPLENAEGMQLIHYASGQEYRPHYDAYDLNSDRGIRCTKNGGQRLVTALIYLNNVQKGGGTIFPKLDIIVEAKAGRVLLFANTLLNKSMPHSLSLHGGLPVEEGEKWAVNLWFRQFPVAKEVKRKNPLSNSFDVPSDFDSPGHKSLSKSKISPIDENIPAFSRVSMMSAHAESSSQSMHTRDGIDGDGLTNELSAVDLDQARRWISKCLITDMKEDYIYAVLLEIGFKKHFIESEIKLVQESHSAKAAQKAFRDLTHVGSMCSENALPYIENKAPFKSPSIAQADVADLDGQKGLYVSHLTPPEFPLQIDKARANDIIIIPDIITAEIFDFINKTVSGGSLHPSKRGESVKADQKIRDDYFFNTDECGPLDSYLFSSVASVVKDYYGCEIGFRERWKVGHYAGKNNGFYIPHKDTSGGMKHRIVSCVVMLSSPDQYTGGELVFPDYGKNLKLSQFSAVIFPSGILHGVNPVLSGTRQTLLSFMWSVSNMQLMPGNPIDYLPRVKLNFSAKNYLDRAVVLRQRIGI